MKGTSRIENTLKKVLNVYKEVNIVRKTKSKLFSNAFMFKRIALNTERKWISSLQARPMPQKKWIFKGKIALQHCFLASFVPNLCFKINPGSAPRTGYSIDQGSLRITFKRRIFWTEGFLKPK